MPRRTRGVKLDFSDLPEELSAADSEEDFILDPEPEAESQPESGLEAEDADSEEYEELSGTNSPLLSRRGRPHGSTDRRSKRVKLESPTTSTELRRDTTDTLKSRMQIFYDEVGLLEAVKLRADWGGVQFVTNQPNLLEAIYPPHHSLDIPDPRHSDPDPLLNGSSIVVDGHRLGVGEKRSAEGVELINTGAAVSHLAWSPGHSTHQVLAVSRLDDEQRSPIDAPAVRPGIALSRKTAAATVLCFYYLIDQSTGLRLEATLEFPELVQDFAWRPCVESNEMVIILQSGRVGLVKVPTARGHHVASISYLPLDRPATCVTWQGPDAVLAGCADGSIAMFDATIATLLWVLPIHWSVITQVSSAWPEYPSKFGTASVDGYFRVADSADVRRRHEAAPREAHTQFSAAWSPATRCFVVGGEQVCSRLVSARHPAFSHAPLEVTCHNGTITSIGTSRLHPLVLTGGEDGSLHIANAARRTLSGRRPKVRYCDCSLWTLECSDRTSEYHFVESLRVAEVGKPGKSAVRLHPRAVAVTSVSWIPTKQWWSWYAAGTASGIIRLENLACQ